MGTTPELTRPLALFSPMLAVEVAGTDTAEGGYSQYEGPTPLLVVGSVNGAVWVLQAPCKAHTALPNEHAEIPHG